MHSTRSQLKLLSTIQQSNLGSGQYLRRIAYGVLGFATVAMTLLAGTEGLQNAVANGDTRTLSFYHAHTRESLTVTFRRNGRYDRSELQKLNWFLRDWRNNDTVAMDPKLFDIVWAAQREAGSRGTIKVLSAYRSPKTNAMLRRRSSAVAKNSQHMVGKALDFSLPDADMAKVRAIGMRLQRGGVGYYPNVPFVHLDSGSVRSWPRMPRHQLAQLFPDGKTVHVPADGKPLEGFEIAKREILARGDSVPGVSAAPVAAVAEKPVERRRSLWASLFGSSDEEEVAASAVSRRQIAAAPSHSRSNAAYEDASDTRQFFARDNARAKKAHPSVAARQGSAGVAASALQITPPARIAGGAQIANSPSALIQAHVAAGGPLPVPRPGKGMDALLARIEKEPVASIAMLPLPPRRVGTANIDRIASITIAGLSSDKVPLPPVRPGKLGREQGAVPNALARLGTSIIRTTDDEVAALRTVALAYAPMEAVATHPLPPMPPVRPTRELEKANLQTRISPSLPSQAVIAGEERQLLRRLFAGSVTRTSLAPDARIKTARVSIAQPEKVAAARAAAPDVVVPMGFSKSSELSELSTRRFTGPAVKPLPTARFYP